MEKIISNLQEFYNNAPEISLHEDERLVIFSDLHMGDETNLDDFRIKEDLFSSVLEHYYLQDGYKLILNGDVEELQKSSIQYGWKDE